MMTQKKYGQLRPITQIKLLQNETDVVAHSAFTQEQGIGNLTIAQPLCDAFDNLFFLVVNPKRGQVPTLLMLHEKRQLADNFVAKDALPDMHRLQGGDNAFKILFENIPLGPWAEGAYATFMIMSVTQCKPVSVMHHPILC